MNRIRPLAWNQMKPFLIVCQALLLTVCGGCKPDGSPAGDNPSSSQERQSGGEGEGEMPWPPPGGAKAEVPPGVASLMDKMLNAFNGKKASDVERFFVNRESFLAVSDCEPRDVVDRVMEGRRQAGERATREGGSARFEGWKEGYIFELKKGDKPAECRAREDVGLFMARFNWVVNGKSEVGEAHFLRINGIWYFAKF